MIETVITPREGCKLVIRSSKGVSQEDYYVDAVEVVSFGHSFFFRSQERPKSFLVPVSDYEVLELKETRMVLKNVSNERSIKIGGGAAPRPREEAPDAALTDSRPAPQPEQRSMGKRDKRRRGRRGRDRHDHPEQQPLPAEEPRSAPQELAPAAPQQEELVKAPSFISKLFPPPPTLIKENLSRYKPSDEEPPLEDFPIDKELEDESEE